MFHMVLDFHRIDYYMEPNISTFILFLFVNLQCFFYRIFQEFTSQNS